MGQPGKAYFYGSTLGGGEAVSTTTVNDGAWHHIVGVYSRAGTLVIYVDGVPVESTRVSEPIRPNAAPFLIGGMNRGGTPTACFTGLLDDVQVYNHALSDAEVEFVFTHPGHAVDSPLLTITALDPSRLRLCWLSELNRSYQLQYASELIDSNWLDFGNAIPGTGTTVCVLDVIGSAHRFYRLMSIVIP